MKNVVIYTDGACSFNPGPGGWCAILIYGANEKVLSGGLQDTTNNIMELSAVVNGLRALKEPCNVEIYSDSAYVVNSISEGWIDSWQKNGWKTSKKESVKNIEIWKELLKLLKVHNVTFLKVKGHSDDEYNNRCDEVARSEVKKLMDELK